MSIKNSKRFAEIEYSLQHYFEGSVLSVMKQVRKTLNDKQVKELADYQRSPAGIMASSNPMLIDMGWQAVRTAGEWNSKTTEDYLRMCNEKMQNDKAMQRDFALLSAEWRKAVVEQIGRTKYDALSKQIGCDLAYAYIGQRMEDLMINKLVVDDIPKSSMEYIMRKAAKQSIWGFTEELMKSPLTKEIEARSEKAYKPSNAEKVTGRVAGSAVDAVSMGAFNGWTTFAKFVGCDVALGYALDKTVGNTEQRKEQVMELSISKGIFGSNSNVFSGFRKHANELEESGGFLQTLNGQLTHKIKLPTKKYKPVTWTTNNNNKSPFPVFTPNTDFLKPKDIRKDPKYKDVPLIVAPGKEDDYLKEKAQQEAVKQKEAEHKRTEKEQGTDGSGEVQPVDASSDDEQANQLQQTNENAWLRLPPSRLGHSSELDGSRCSVGWEGLLANFGLDGFGDITHNLGYVLAMLPDMLVGLLTGKTKSLNMDNSMIPLASIVAGMFVKNPILKMILIGMGGANLINKAGHEALERKANEGLVPDRYTASNRQVAYRQYADEPLNPRLSNPVLQGSCLIVHIDRVPCTIQLPQTVVDAYQAGALPLNTLANAILAKNEQMQSVAMQQYENGREERETVSRSRGIQ